MSKNLTRKSLAFGALVALASTLIAGAPASAVGVDDGSVTIAPTTGTSYNALLTTDFKLNVNYVSGIAINGGKLSALIEDSTAQVKASFSQASGVAVATQTFTSGSVVVQSASTSDSAGASTADVLRLSLPSSVTATTPVGITVWYDSNADKVIDANEKVAAKKTLTFYAPGSITWTAVMNQPSVSATTISATVKPSIALNGEQIGDAGEVTADFTSSVSAAQTTAANDTDLTTVYNVDDKLWLVTSDTVTSVVAGNTYSAQSKVSTALQGTRVYASVATVEAAKVSAEFVTSADVTDAGLVRATQRTATLKATVTKATGAAIGAGVPVDFTLTLTTGSFTGKTAVNGVEKSSFTSNGATTTATAYTDANGVATLTVKAPEDVAAADVITISWASVQGSATNTESGGSATGTAAAQTITWATPDYTVFDTSIDGEVYGTTYGNVYTAVAGSSKSISLKVVDQWKSPLTATDHVIKAVVSGRTTNTSYTPVVSGTATITVADSANTGDTNVVILTLEKKSGSTYTAASDSTTPKSTAGTNMLDAQGILINYVAASQTYKVTLGGTKANVAEDLSGTVSSDAVVAANTDLNNVAAPVSSPSVKVVGFVANATTGALGIGNEVTVSGADLLFNVGSQYGLGTLTFRANASGEFAVNVFANKVTSGTVVTVTSGSASATKSVVFTSSLDAKSLILTAPAYAAAGTAVDVVATLADKWGNGVSADALTLSSTGAGYLNATGSTTTLTSGVARAKLIFGAADTGSAVITATVTTSSTYVLAADKTKTATVVIGKAPAAAGSTTAAVSGSTGKFFVSATAAAGKSVVVKVAGKFVTSFKATGSKKSVAVKATKGSKKVTVFVGGKLVATKTVTVK